MRAKWVGMQRNACVALGNLHDPFAVPALARALEGANPLVKQHAAWALGRIGGSDARIALESASLSELDPDVRRGNQAGVGRNRRELVVVVLDGVVRRPAIPGPCRENAEHARWSRLDHCPLVAGRRRLGALLRRWARDPRLCVPGRP